MASAASSARRAIASGGVPLWLLGNVRDLGTIGLVGQVADTEHQRGRRSSQFDRRREGAGDLILDNARSQKPTNWPISRADSRRSLKGHEDLFPPRRLNAHYPFTIGHTEELLRDRR